MFWIQSQVKLFYLDPWNFNFQMKEQRKEQKKEQKNEQISEQKWMKETKKRDFNTSFFALFIRWKPSSIHWILSFFSWENLKRTQMKINRSVAIRYGALQNAIIPISTCITQ